jgi:hypothetical protein
MADACACEGPAGVGRGTCAAGAWLAASGGAYPGEVALDDSRGEVGQRLAADALRAGTQCEHEQHVAQVERLLAR